MRRNSQRRGLTMIELMVVSGIMTTVAGILVPAVMQVRKPVGHLAMCQQSAADWPGLAYL